MEKKRNEKKGGGPGVFEKGGLIKGTENHRVRGGPRRRLAGEKTRVRKEVLWGGNLPDDR